MKVLVIPDIHQTTTWQKLFEYDIAKDADAIVQLGDWFDTWKPDWKDNAPIKNFEKAFELKEEYPNFHILIGNHDMSYVLHDGCSGYQSSHAYEIQKAIMSHVDKMDVGVALDGWVFSHAGFSMTWMHNKGFASVSQVNKTFHDIVNFLKFDKEFSDGNKLRPSMAIRRAISKDDFYSAHKDLQDEAKALLPKIKEEVKKFTGKDFSDIELDMFVQTTLNTFRFSGNNCYGDDVTQGPLWIRPASLLSDMFFDKQCVGHTEVYDCPESYYDYQSNLLVVDNRKHDTFFILDTEHSTWEKIVIQ